METERFSLSHIAALDGIRGLAIVFVLCSHIPLTFLRGGGLGVEIFFVLSGFLITSLLLKEFDNKGRVAFKSFYMRRVLRLAPALLISIVVVNVFALLFIPAEMGKVLFDTFITLFYSINWGHAFFFSNGPFLNHAWSLSIEEQFYLFFPGLLGLLLRNLNHRWSVIVVVALIGFLSWLWRAYLIGHDAGFSRTQYGTDTRLDGLIAGSVLALLLSTSLYGHLRALAKRHRGVFDATALMAFVCLLLIVWRAEGMLSVTYYVGFPLLQVSTCILIWHFATFKNSSLTALFSWPVLVWLGKISYGLYLYHWIVLYILMTIFPDWQGVTTHGFWAATIGIVTALFSYKYIETPILRYKRKYRTQEHSA